MTTPAMESEYEANTRIKLGFITLIAISKDKRKLKTTKLAPIKIIVIGFLPELGIEPTLHGVIFFNFGL